jgi:hypothetical protein
VWGSVSIRLVDRPSPRPNQVRRTYVWRLTIIANNDNDSGGVEPSTSRSTGHLGIFSREEIPERPTVVFPSGSEDYRPGRHIDTLHQSELSCTGPSR